MGRGDGPDRMDLTWLRDFEALAETGNFSRAAEARHVTQPAFSRRIRALEDWAGTALFERGAQPIVPNEAGARLRPLFSDIVRRLDEARQEAGAVASGSLRFAATHALSFSFFPAWLSDTGSAPAGVAIHLISDSLDSCERLMLAGRAEFLLCHHHDAAPGRLAAPAFASRSVGGDHLLLLRAPLPPGSARRAPVLGYGEGSGLARIVAAAGPRLPAPVFTSHLAATLRRMALDGAGMAWLPESLVAADLADGTLVRAGPPDIPVEIRLFRAAEGGTRAGRAFWRAIETAPDA